ncbi:ABC-2 type transport system permease protein [Dinghuibacter silviterrae]|uniref:ABC-2 type transport system permease protein n=1 Tax=Dinghuibacter silviterrae TaxID=1539049 RepID=A0A4R8DRU4_9BACT|nr:ABC-2 type transport system permease protein [Dinghuibacter silviterrae]
MWPLLRIELWKIYRKPRTYISFLAIAAMVWLIQLGLYADGENYIRFGMQSLTASFDLSGKILNGYLVCFVILQTFLMQVPLLIALVAGDMIAGEANTGTLRLLLTKPMGRGELLAAKFAATFVYTVTLLLWMALLALLGSLLIFGVGDLMIMRNREMDLLLSGDVPWRYAAAFGFAIVAMTAVASLAFLFSVFAENAIGPIVSTVSAVIVLTILSTMDIPFFNRLKPYLFTTHMIGWKGFFYTPVPWHDIMGSLAVLLGHILAFGAVTWIVFTRKDILS